MLPGRSALQQVVEALLKQSLSPMLMLEESSVDCTEQHLTALHAGAMPWSAISASMLNADARADIAACWATGFDGTSSSDDVTVAMATTSPSSSASSALICISELLGLSAVISALFR